MLFSSCEEDLLKHEFKNTPRGNYDVLWSEFDRLYGAFEAKHINWDSLGEVYRSQIYDETTGEELFSLMSGLIAELNDGHVDIYAPEFGLFSSWSRRRKPYFKDVVDQDWSDVVEMRINIKAEYLKGRQREYTDDEGYNFFSGYIENRGKTYGYLCIPTFTSDNFPFSFVSSAVDSFRHTSGVLLDLRFNGGGMTENFVKVMNIFSSEKKLFLKSRLRDGTEHNDLSEMTSHYTNPGPSSLRDVPIAVLVNSFTASAAEHLLLGLESQPGVFSIGDTTHGAFSTVKEKILPNGWQFRIGPQVVYAPNGRLLANEEGEYLEGIGIAPDYYSENKLAFIRMGYDLVIVRAIHLFPDE